MHTEPEQSASRDGISQTGQLPGRTELRDLELPWTGERLVPTYLGDTAIEHLHRYVFARDLAVGKDVLDIACGEGYGSHLLGAVAKSVVGVDISPEVIAHAARKYGTDSRLSFKVGSCTAFPIPDASVDLIVSFETLEHLCEHEQMMQECKRVLRPGGMLVISTPEKLSLAHPPDANPFHLREVSKAEFSGLLGTFFQSVHLLEQKICNASVVGPSPGPGMPGIRSYLGDFRAATHRTGLKDPLYNLAVATDGAEPLIFPVSLYEGLGIPTEVEIRQAETVARLAHAQGTLIQAEVRLSETQARLTETQVCLNEAHARLGETESQLGDSRAQLSQARNNLVEYQSRHDDYHARCLQAEAELRGIKASTTFRLALRVRKFAYPVRKLRNLTRRLLSSRAARS